MFKPKQILSTWETRWQLERPLTTGIIPRHPRAANTSHTLLPDPEPVRSATIPVLDVSWSLSEPGIEWAGVADNAISDESNGGPGRDGENFSGGAIGVTIEVTADVNGSDVLDGAPRVDIVVLADILPFWVGGAAHDKFGEAVYVELSVS